MYLFAGVNVFIAGFIGRFVEVEGGVSGGYRAGD